MNVFLIAAITLDGFIAEETAQVSTSWTSKEDKKWFNERTKQAKVMVMGSSTYKTIGRPLPGRLTIVMTRGNIEGAAPNSPELRTFQGDPGELIDQLEKEGYEEVAICGGSQIYTQFMKARIITKIYVTVEPIVLGKGVPLFSEEIKQRLQLRSYTQMGENALLLEYEVLPLVQ